MIHGEEALNLIGKGKAAERHQGNVEGGSEELPCAPGSSHTSACKNFQFPSKLSALHQWVLIEIKPSGLFFNT